MEGAGRIQRRAVLGMRRGLLSAPRPAAAKKEAGCRGVVMVGGSMVNDSERASDTGSSAQTMPCMVQMLAFGIYEVDFEMV